MPDLAATSLWSFEHKASTAGGAEVVAFDGKLGLLFVLGADGVDALDAATGGLRFSLPKAALGSLGTGNSVAVESNQLAVAFDGSEPGAQGLVALYDLDPRGTGATLAHAVTVGAVPDMVTFVSGHHQLLVAIEGEPTPDYASDPVGGVAVIDTRTGGMTFAGFSSFDTAALKADGVRITGPSGTEATTDLELEYITVAGDKRTAYVSLQENNAIGVLDLHAKEGPVFTAVLPLGTKDHAVPGQGLDASDRDGDVAISTSPVKGLYMPDAVTSFQAKGHTYLVTANEGDAREWGSYTDFARVATQTLDPVAFPNAVALQDSAALGRLQISTRDGDVDGDGDLDALYSFGARSFSIWQVGKDGLSLTFDSGNLIERSLAEIAPSLLDDNRSDDKGPEPEHVTLGRVRGDLYAFVALERADSIMAFRIDGPEEVEFAGLIAAPGDDAPEVLAFAAARGGEPPRLFVANEGSGTSRAFGLELGEIVSPFSTSSSDLF